ncbi:MAG: hypothetical protein JWL97_3784 [Gemmatimonadales bacterium]|nr:hypothetical protein [Gemmatimonadales bacterium]
MIMDQPGADVVRGKQLVAVLAAARLLREQLPAIANWHITEAGGVRALLSAVADTDARSAMGQWAVFLGSQVHTAPWHNPGEVEIWTSARYEGAAVRIWCVVREPAEHPVDGVPGQLPLVMDFGGGGLQETAPGMYERVNDL